MDDSTLYARMHANVREFCRLMGGASPGRRVIELDGVVGSSSRPRRTARC